MLLYLGDGHIKGSAAYLSGVMLHSGIPFDRVDSDQPVPTGFTKRGYDAYILSDYPALGFSAEQLQELSEAVRQGAGLLMIGGWESFHGRLGEYHRSILAELLPVEMMDEDDRRNDFRPTLIHPCVEHPVLQNLPWNIPPCVGGYNLFKAKPTAETLLLGSRCEFHLTDSDRSLTDRLSFTLADPIPMLVLGSAGAGRTAALATDVAPHWVGGFVDWGQNRVTQEVPGGEDIEVGNYYVQFLTQLLRWVKNEP